MRLTRAKFLLTFAAAVLVLSACGSDAASTSSSSSGSGSSKATTFVLDEWSVMAPTGGVPAGKVAISATNNGKETHEIVFVRAADAASLPTKSNGSVDEAKIPEGKKAGEIADLAAGKTATKTLDLPAGDYVAFCNLVDDMGSGGMSDGSGMGSGGMGSGGMNHVHFKLETAISSARR